LHGSGTEWSIRAVAERPAGCRWRGGSGGRGRVCRRSHTSSPANPAAARRRRTRARALRACCSSYLRGGSVGSIRSTLKRACTADTMRGGR